MLPLLPDVLLHVLLQRAHVTTAIKEMFESTHMQLLRNASRMELMLLVAVALEMRAASRNDVVLLAAAKRLADTVCSWTNDDKPCSGGGPAGLGGGPAGCAVLCMHAWLPAAARVT
jgi:hypothetical protein